MSSPLKRNEEKRGSAKSSKPGSIWCSTALRSAGGAAELMRNSEPLAWARVLDSRLATRPPQTTVSPPFVIQLFALFLLSPRRQLAGPPSQLAEWRAEFTFASSLTPSAKTANRRSG